VYKPSCIYTRLNAITSKHLCAQVNAAVDEAAALGEATAKLVATMRRDSRAVPVAERKRAQTLLHSVVVRHYLREQSLAGRQVKNMVDQP